jgi:hypothetical protein
MKRWIFFIAAAVLLMLSIPRDAPFHAVYRKIKVTIQTVYFHFKYARSRERHSPRTPYGEQSSSDEQSEAQPPPRSRKLMKQMGENAEDERPKTFDDRLEETFDNWKKEE